MPIPFFKIGDIVPEVTIPISLLSLSKILYPFLGIPLSINSNPIKYFSSPNSSLNYPFKDESFSYIEAIPTLAWVSNLEKFFSETFRLTKPNGLLGFGSFGLGTLENFFYYFNKRNKNNERKKINLIDMHDVGDICFSAGYIDPIILSSKVTLQYNNEILALKELRSFFGNPEKNRFRGLKGKDFKKLVLSSLSDCRSKEGLIELDIELVYGHAWKLDRKNCIRKYGHISFWDTSSLRPLNYPEDIDEKLLWKNT